MDAKTVDYTVCAGCTVIGKVCLADWDRGMGVAGGIFVPNENYVPQLHASEVDGAAQVQSEAMALTIVDAFGGQPFLEDIYLMDWASEAGPDGRELTVFGIDILGVFGPESPVDKAE